MTTLPPSPWFRPKTHGFGAYPINWKGWALIGGFVVADLVLVLALIYFILPTRPGEPASVPLLVLWALILTALVAIFIWITKLKTEGEWRWRWGDRDTR